VLSLYRRYLRSGLSATMACIAIASCGAVLSPTAQASQAVDQLSDCLVKSITAADQTTLLQWTFSALAAHPDLKALSNISSDQKTALDQKLAQVLERVLVDQCAAQTKAVIASDGLSAVTTSFKALGRQAGEQMLQDPAVSQQLKNTLRYVNLSKLATVFLSPEVFSKWGSSD
jgi:hypothetical protein